MKKLFLSLLLAVSSMGMFAQNDAIDNKTVLDLLKEGFTSEEIIGAIENSSTRSLSFDISFMRQLKEAGADASLTTYIQKAAKTDNGYEGVVLWNPVDGGKPSKVFRTNFEKEEKGFNLGTIAGIGLAAYGLGSAFGGHTPSSVEAAGVATGAGLLASSAKDVQKLMLPGGKAKVTASTQPVFRFFFERKEGLAFSKEAANYYEMVMNEIQSPNEFQCVKMTVKEKKKGSRRIFPEKMSYTVAGFSGSNASTRDMVNFEIKAINNYTFEVTFAEPLEPGEYCFFYKGGLNNKYFQAAPFGFDFSVE